MSSSSFISKEELHELEVAELKAALAEAISAGEYVVNLVEEDQRAGVSPNPMERSHPTAALAHCYAAMAFLNRARKALKR